MKFQTRSLGDGLQPVSYYGPLVAVTGYNLVYFNYFKLQQVDFLSRETYKKYTLSANSIILDQSLSTEIF